MERARFSTATSDNPRHLRLASAGLRRHESRRRRRWRRPRRTRRGRTPHRSRHGRRSRHAARPRRFRNSRRAARRSSGSSTPITGEQQLRNPINVIPPAAPTASSPCAMPASAGSLLVTGLSRLTVANSRSTSAIIDSPLGQGHVVLFSNNPFWRAETKGSYFLVFTWQPSELRQPVSRPKTSRQISSRLCDRVFCGGGAGASAQNTQQPTRTARP